MKENESEKFLFPERTQRKIEYNSELNDSLLLFQRAKNHIIKKQIIDLLMLIEADKKTSDLKSREEIEKEYDKKLEAIQSDTPIDYDVDSGGVAEIRERDDDDNIIKEEKREFMPLRLRTCLPPTEQALTEKQMSIMEAHEKGHILRPYESTDRILERYFKPAFDFSAVNYTNDNFIKDKTRLEHLKPDITYEEARELKVDYLFSGEEIVERMSQLKNHFGFSGNEIFTKKHLDYARENYIKDTGIDNNMTAFFEAITPQTEAKFLELINKSGI